MRITIGFGLLVVSCSPSVPEPSNQDAAIATAAASASSPPEPVPTQTARAMASASAPAKTLSVACTKKGCKSDLELRLRWDKDVLTKGHYSFVVEGDGKTGRCETNFPPKNCSNPDPPKCSGDLAISIEQICAELDGALKGQKMLGLLAVHIPDAPKQVSLTVSRNGKQIGKYETQPKYETLRPNGPECPPICSRASEEACIGPCKQ